MEKRGIILFLQISLRPDDSRQFLSFASGFSFNLLLFVIFEYFKKVWPHLDFVVLKRGEMFYQIFQRAVDIFV